MAEQSLNNVAGISVTQPEAEAWDRFVAGQPRAHLLQLSLWGELKAQFGWEAQVVALETGGDLVAGALVLLKRLPLRLGKMAYVPMGAYAQEKALYPLLWEAIKQRTSAAFLKLEPGHAADDDDFDLAGMGFQPSPQTIQPSRTIIIDIAGAEGDIMARMNQGTRRKIRKSRRSDILYKEGSRADLRGFCRLMQETGERNAFGVHTEKYFESVYDLFMPRYGKLLLAQHEDELLAAIMVFALGDTAWYLYGASSRVKSNLYATYGIQWAAIEWARQRGCRYYDFWGVPDHDQEMLEAQFRQRQDGLWGVYGFKRGWGGELRRTSGAWDKVFNPLVYAGYRAAIKRRS